MAKSTWRSCRIPMRRNQTVAAARDAAPPVGETETRLAALWAEMLACLPSAGTRTFSPWAGTRCWRSACFPGSTASSAARCRLSALIGHPTVSRLAALIEPPAGHGGRRPKRGPDRDGKRPSRGDEGEWFTATGVLHPWWRRRGLVLPRPGIPDAGRRAHACRRVRRAVQRCADRTVQASRKPRHPYVRLLLHKPCRRAVPAGRVFLRRRGRARDGLPVAGGGPHGGFPRIVRHAQPGGVHAALYPGRKAGGILGAKPGRAAGQPVVALEGTHRRWHRHEPAGALGDRGSQEPPARPRRTATCGASRCARKTGVPCRPTARVRSTGASPCSRP